MTPHPLIKALAILLIITLIVPSIFFSAPQHTHAFGFGLNSVIVVGDVSETSLLQLAKDVLIEIHTFTSAVAEYALFINTYILQPLLFVLSGRLLKSMTAGVLGFVTGLSNGTGRPQFVQNLSGNLQNVGDASAFAFFDSYIRNMGSPFASSIVSALRIDYVRTTSLAGFYGANRDTLTRTSPNINAYLAGDWSQGGLASWFALTTQDNNNPYMLYLNSQSQVRSLVGPGVGGATGVRLAQLSWGQGMLSWCGTDETASEPLGPANGTEGTVPGDPCVNNDGTPGRVKTPGSVISATLNKVLGATQDKIVQMGALASEVNLIMGDITRIMQTVNIAGQILSGPDSKGLAGADAHDSRVFLGVSASTVYQSAAGSQTAATNLALVSETQRRVDQYEMAWLTIKSSADTALTSVNALASACATSSAQTAITTEIQPVLAKTASAATVVAAARAMIQQVQAELDSGEDASADIQKLIAMPPSLTDVTNASRDAQTSGGATATPEGSLTVSGGSVVDRMNLISTNATKLKASPTCAASSTL